MFQKTYFVTNVDELERTTHEVKALPEYQNAHSRLAVAYADMIGRTEAESLVAMLREELPELKIAGISVLTSRDSWNERGLTLSFCFFEDSDVDIFTLPSSEYSDDAVVDKISNVIRGNGDVKAVLIFPTILDGSVPGVLNRISAVDETIQYFGAFSATRFISDEDETYDIDYSAMEKFVTSNGSFFGYNPYSIGDSFIDRGYVFAVLSGKRLWSAGRYVFGWHPLGKGLHITGRMVNENGEESVTMIDGEPAIKIYKKYLNVEKDKYFMDNVCEFPMVVKRGDVYIGRVPRYTGDSNELFFSGDIGDDEEIRLSYANPSELIRLSQKAASEIKEFEPEGLFLVACSNRRHFLKSDEIKEIDAFRDYNKELVQCYGGSEILRCHNCGGVLNSALVVMGLKEADEPGNAWSMQILQEDNVRDVKIPFHERLLTFIEASTKELEEALVDAEQANKSKSAFLSNMSHEIRTPINAVLGMDEMILRESEDDNIIQYAENIRSAGNSLLGIVNDVLDFSKIEAGKMDIVPVEYEVASVLNDLVNMVRKRAEDKGLTLNVEVDPNIPHLLYGDEIRIKQVITNILTNAVKYTEKGSVTLSVSYTEYDNDDSPELVEDMQEMLIGSCRCQGKYFGIISVSVTDTGIGIKSEDIPKLYSAFERIEERRNRTIEGTGLGMSITQSLLDMMGSMLIVQSEYGKGSTFSFNLIQKVVDPRPIGDFEEALRRSIAARKQYKESFIAPDAHILVVDDTTMNLTVIKNLLKRTKVKIDTAESGKDCLDLVSHNNYDLIFLDHRMPEMDGMETLKRLKQMDEFANAHIPVIALTANAISGSREMYLDAGFDDYLSKPIDPELLEGLITKNLPAELVIKTDEIETADVAENKDNSTDVKIPEEIMESDNIDEATGIKNCGSADSYIEALKSYLDSSDDNYEQLNSYLNSNDIENFTTKVHALKSTSRIIGALSLGDIAESLEKAGNDGSIDFISEKSPELFSLYRTVAGTIRAAFSAEDSDDSDKEEIPASKLKEAYGAVKEIAQMFDYDSLTLVMDSLKGYRIPDNEKENYKHLIKAYKNADWDALRNIS